MLVQHSALNGVGLLAATALQFALLTAVSRGLSTASAGVFFEVFATFRILWVVATLGLDDSMVRFVAVRAHSRDRARLTYEVRAAVWASLSAGVLVALILAGFAPVIGSLLGDSQYADAAAVMGIALPAAACQAVVINALRGAGRVMPFVFVDQLLTWLLRAGAVAISVAMSPSVTYAAGGFAAACWISMVVSCACGRDLLRGPATPSPLRPLARFAVYQWAALVTGVALLWLDVLVLGAFRPPNDVALYTVASRLALLGVMFTLPIAMAFQPMIARLHHGRDIDGLHREYVTSTQLCVIFGVEPLLFLAFFSGPLLALTAGNSYTTASTVVAVLCLGQAVNALTGPSGYMVTMLGRSDLTLQNTAFAVAVNATCNLALIPPYGVMGAAVARSISTSAWNILKLCQVWFLLHIHPFGSWVWRATACVALSATAIGFVRIASRDAGDGVAVAAGIAITAAAVSASAMALRSVVSLDSTAPIEPTPSADD